MANIKPLQTTKGTWKVKYLEHKYTVHIDGFPKKIVARMGSMEASGITMLEHEANAYLLANAANLYKSCIAAAKALTGDTHKQLRARIYNELKKARGPL